MMEQQELPGGGRNVVRNKQGANANQAPADPVAGAGTNPQEALYNEDTVLDMIKARCKNLEKKQKQIAELLKRPDSELSEQQKEKKGSKACVDAVVTELQNLQNLIKPPPPSAEKKEAAAKEKKEKSKNRREARKEEERLALASQAKPASFQNILWKETDEQILLWFNSFCTGFKFRGQAQSLCTGIAKLMVVCQDSVMTIKYAHLQAHDNQMAMKICKFYGRISPKLTDAARLFFHNVWASAQETEPIKDLLARFTLEIEGLPRSHTTLDTYMQQPMCEARQLENTKFDSTTPKANLMVTETLREVIGRIGVSWNGEFSGADIEVIDECKFKITKKPQYKFDPLSEISEETAQWFMNDFTEVWNSVCSKVVAGCKNSLPPHYPALRKKLTNTKKEVFCNPHSLEVLRTVLINNPASKHALARSYFLSGAHTACRGYDMGDPEAPFKNILFEEIMPGLLWSTVIQQSGNKVLTRVLNFNPQNEGLPQRDQNVKYRAPGDVDNPEGETFDTRKEFLQYLQTKSHDIRGPTFGAFLEYSRHLPNHGLTHGMDELETKSLPVGEDGIEYKMQVNPGPRKQKIQDLGLLESAVAVYVEEGLTDMITVLLEGQAMTGMMEGIFENYKNSK